MSSPEGFFRGVFQPVSPVFLFSAFYLCHVLVSCAAVIGMGRVFGAVSPLIVVTAKALTDTSKAGQVRMPPSFGVGRGFGVGYLGVYSFVDCCHYVVEVMVDAGAGLNGTGRWDTG